MHCMCSLFLSLTLSLSLSLLCCSTNSCDIFAIRFDFAFSNVIRFGSEKNDGKLLSSRPWLCWTSQRNAQSQFSAVQISHEITVNASRFNVSNFIEAFERKTRDNFQELNSCKNRINFFPIRISPNNLYRNWFLIAKRLYTNLIYGLNFVAKTREYQISISSTDIDK